MATKYIRTKDNKIIVFSGLNNHSDFKNFNPVSAGFINFNIDKNNEVKCECYGRSISLNLESEPEVDTMLAQMQIADSRY
jgi:hypothetical protein